MCHVGMPLAESAPNPRMQPTRHKPHSADAGAVMRFETADGVTIRCQRYYGVVRIASSSIPEIEASRYTFTSKEMTMWRNTGLTPSGCRRAEDSGRLSCGESANR